MDEAPVTPELPDANIVSRVRGGDRTAYAELIRRYQHRLRSFLSFYYVSQDEIEEHLQDAFVQAFLSLTTYDLSAPFYPWLRSIALNSLKMEFRRLRTARRRGIDYLQYIQLEKLEDDPEGTQSEARAGALHHCLSKLPEGDAALLAAKYTERRPLHELAARFASTVGALKVRLLRLRNILRACIQKQLAAEERA
ncbi:MAG: sigma-70 family RNA polymerase sigma factor [Planctomycetota bacterium]|nr:sigma-70 family RNA polymerase sigma factor [Planctomycetota bacterium]